MGLYDVWWNSVQAGQISELEERVKDLEKKVVYLKEWVDYLEAERKKTNDATYITTNKGIT